MVLHNLLPLFPFATRSRRVWVDMGVRAGWHGACVCTSYPQLALRNQQQLQQPAAGNHSPKQTAAGIACTLLCQPLSHPGTGNGAGTRSSGAAFR